MNDIGLAVWTVLCMVVGGMFVLIFQIALSGDWRGPEEDEDEDPPDPGLDSLDWENELVEFLDEMNDK